MSNSDCDFDTLACEIASYFVPDDAMVAAMGKARYKTFISDFQEYLYTALNFHGLIVEDPEDQIVKSYPESILAPNAPIPPPVTHYYNLLPGQTTNVPVSRVGDHLPSDLTRFDPADLATPYDALARGIHANIPLNYSMEELQRIHDEYSAN